jgi:hypothetical protein
MPHPIRATPHPAELCRSYLATLHPHLATPLLLRSSFNNYFRQSAKKECENYTKLNCILLYLPFDTKILLNINKYVGKISILTAYKLGRTKQKQFRRPALSTILRSHPGQWVRGGGLGGGGRVQGSLTDSNLQPGRWGLRPASKWGLLEPECIWNVRNLLLYFILTSE